MTPTHGPITPGKGAVLAALLESRAGVRTTVQLADGQEILSLNSAWGRDLGEDWEHVYLNMSPSVEDLPTEFVLTRDVVRVLDTETGEVLYVRSE